jgi:hypothetical protein
MIGHCSTTQKLQCRGQNDGIAVEKKKSERTPLRSEGDGDGESSSPKLGRPHLGAPAPSPSIFTKTCVKSIGKSQQSVHPRSYSHREIVTGIVHLHVGCIVDLLQRDYISTPQCRPYSNSKSTSCNAEKL